MKYFTKDEFKTISYPETGAAIISDWFDYYPPYALDALDSFRGLWGDKVVISNAAQAQGRFLGLHIKSRHNINRWGCILAFDVFPAGMSSVRMVRRAETLAQEAGFNGIGFYNDTSSPMLHLDLRDKRARWGRDRGQYTTFQLALDNWNV